MKCEQVVISGYALRRMFERSISVEAVLAIVAGGEIISEYPDDSPYRVTYCSGLWASGDYISS